MRKVQDPEENLDGGDGNSSVLDVRVVWLQSGRAVHVSDEGLPVGTGRESSGEYLEFSLLEAHGSFLDDAHNGVGAWVERFGRHFQV